tara:strand:+ start:260 stop:583 length:324 start_codon:yes stop_codon:yes gene_type:complete
MKIHKKGDFEYWWNPQTQCWWAIEIDPKTGYQVENAHNQYRKDQILQVVNEEQEKLNRLRLEVGEPEFSSEECLDHQLSLKVQLECAWKEVQKLAGELKERKPGVFI